MTDLTRNCEKARTRIDMDDSFEELVAAKRDAHVVIAHQRREEANRQRCVLIFTEKGY